MKLTPSALESGASQLNQIMKLIKECRFAVVALDGLRPNVVFEFGAIRNAGKPVILLKERDAKVDVAGFLGDAAQLSLPPPALDLNSHLSDVKDLNYSTWSRVDPAGTVKMVWEEYCKKKDEIENYIEIEEPKLW